MSTCSKNISFKMGTYISKSFNSISCSSDGLLQYDESEAYDGAEWTTVPYRIITINEPIKYTDDPEFYKWFDENTVPANKTITTGQYLFKVNPSVYKPLESIFSFRDGNNSAWEGITVTTGQNIVYAQNRSWIAVFTSGLWDAGTSRIITISQDTPVTEEFYNWFTSNLADTNN